MNRPGLILLAWLRSVCFQLHAAPRPDIPYILAEDMNRDCWGIYGSRDCKTPNIDRLAAERLRFGRACAAVAMFRQELYSRRSPWRTGPNQRQP